MPGNTSQKALLPLTIDHSVKQNRNNKEIGNREEIGNNEEIVEIEATEVMEPLEKSKPKSIQDLQQEVFELKSKLQEAEIKLSRCIFRLENFKGDDTMIKLYTGFTDHETLMAFYQEILEADAAVEWAKK